MSAQTLLRRAIGAQTKAELLLTTRRGENILITLIVPIALLIFFMALGVPGIPPENAVGYLLPGMLTLAIIANGMVSLGIATAYERYYGVLKRLGASPLPRSGLLLAKSLAVLALEIVQVAAVVAVAVLVYGWRPQGNLVLAAVLVVLGTVAFAALGLAMAGALRAEATLAGANALYLLFLLTSGAVLPLDHLPNALAAVSQFLPAAALATSLRDVLTTGTLPPIPLVVLLVWLFGGLLVASFTFKWE